MQSMEYRTIKARPGGHVYYDVCPGPTGEFGESTQVRSPPGDAPSDPERLSVITYLTAVLLYIYRCT